MTLSLIAKLEGLKELFNDSPGGIGHKATIQLCIDTVKDHLTPDSSTYRRCYLAAERSLIGAVGDMADGWKAPSSATVEIIVKAILTELRPGEISEKIQTAPVCKDAGGESIQTEQPDDCRKAFEMWCFDNLTPLAGTDAADFRWQGWHGGWTARHDPIKDMIGRIAEGQLKQQQAIGMDYLEIRGRLAELSGVPTMAITTDEHLKRIKARLERESVEADAEYNKIRQALIHYGNLYTSTERTMYEVAKALPHRERAGAHFLLPLINLVEMYRRRG